MKTVTIIKVLFIISVIQPTDASDSLMRAAVYKIKSEVLPEEFTETLTDHIESKLLGYMGYRVISRSNLDVLISEDHLSQSGITNDEIRLVKNGSRSAVDKICTGSISRIGRSYSFTLKMIDVESGRIDAAAQEIYSGPVEGLLDIGTGLLGKIIKTGNGGSKATRSADAIFKPADSKSIDSIPPDLHPTTTGEKEVITRKTTASLPAHVTATSNETTSKNNLVDTPVTQKPSGLGKQISIGAVVIFGTLAALVLLTRNQY